VLEEEIKSVGSHEPLSFLLNSFQGPKVFTCGFLLTQHVSLEAIKFVIARVRG
jgi:hypothetical protein